MALRIPMSRTRPARAEKSSASSSWRPKSFTSSAPATLNRSVMVLFIEALRFMPSRVMACRPRPTRRAGSTNTGRITTASRVSRHSSTNMKTSVTLRVMTLPTPAPSVPVKARWAPITSLLRRLTRVPVWVRVKKASGMRCTWSNSRSRRSKIRPSPMPELNRRSSSDSRASPVAVAINRTNSQLRYLPLPSAMATSKICRITSGGSDPRSVEPITVAMKEPIASR